MPNGQQAVCCNAGHMPAESPVGLSSVHARVNICEPRTTASRRTLAAIERVLQLKKYLRDWIHFRENQG
ncbi:hypothetical protein D0T60_08085 [Bacteroides sp. 224]|nr:hypothetical protein [Bacteroides sp. 224]